MIRTAFAVRKSVIFKSLDRGFNAELAMLPAIPRQIDTGDFGDYGLKEF